MFTPIYWRHMVFAIRSDDGLMDDDVGGVQFHSYSIYKVCLFIIYSFALG